MTPNLHRCAPRRLAIVASAALLTAGLPAGTVLSTAAAATGWTQQTAPPDPSELTGGLTSVSCVGASWCMAIGGGQGSTQPVIAETLHGTRWTLSKQSAKIGFPTSVTCTSTHFCMALTARGIDPTSVATEASSETWNGHGWHMRPIRLPAGASFDSLTSLSCPTAKSCTAVGRANSRNGTYSPMVVHWNGRKWAAQASQHPKKLPDLALTVVSCPSAKWCNALGTTTSKTNVPRLVAERWNGRKWSLGSATASKKLTDIELTGISCTSRTACIAVGNAGTPTSGQRTFAERLAGTHWKTTTTPNVAGRFSDQLSAVSCTAASACTAVGESTDSSLNGRPLAAVWNGRKWSVQKPANPAGGTSTALNGVSCRSSAHCLAVGTETTSQSAGVSLAETQRGKAWKIGHAANFHTPIAVSLGAVSCGSAAACVAIGSYSVTDTGGSEVEVSLSDVWNGATWRMVAMPTLPDSTSVDFASVSCPSSTSCVAVGNASQQGLATSPISATWNGTTWTMRSVPLPGGEDNGGLTGVGCSGTTCQAVGSASTEVSGEIPLAETWDGSSWTIQSVPLPNDEVGGSLLSLSCPAASDCTAVGIDIDASFDQDVLAEVWNGAVWQVQAMAEPADTLEPEADVVGCATGGTCLAMGQGVDSNEPTSISFAEQRSGTSWSASSLPAGGLLSAIDCITATGCVGAGGGIYAWNGTAWSTETTAAGVAKPSFGAVSCRAANTCVAVGSFGNPGSALIESEG